MAKILIVEDELPLSDLFAAAIRILSDSHQVMITERGDDAVRLAREHPPDVIIMDLRLPGMNGIEAIQEIRKFNKTVPIFALTAYTDLHTRQEALAAGANLYLPKPANIPILLAQVQKAIDEAQA